MATAHKTRRKRAKARKRPHAGPVESRQHTKVAREAAEIVIEKIKAGDFWRFFPGRKDPRIPLPEYAKVVAIGNADEVVELKGRVGVVLDASDGDNGRTYTVYFPGKQEAFVLHEQSLWDTGDNVPEEVIYGSGETHRVRVDKDGNGTVVP